MLSGQVLYSTNPTTLRGCLCIVEKNIDRYSSFKYIADSSFDDQCWRGERAGTWETLYVPAYSHIYTGNTERPFLLTVTLSIRNIDLQQTITLSAVDYYETQGKLLMKYIEKPVILGPLQSIRYIIPEKDKTGGSGANFIVSWHSSKQANPPVVETIMIGTQVQQGISFTSRAVEIRKQP